MEIHQKTGARHSCINILNNQKQDDPDRTANIQNHVMLAIHSFDKLFYQD